MRELGPKRFVTPILDTDRAVNAPRGYARFFSALRRYRRLARGVEAVPLEIYPQIHDRTGSSKVDSHYFHQDVWAAQRVARLGPERHVDVGSRVDYVGFLTAITAVTFVDIRPLEAQVEGLTTMEGSVLGMPFADRSLESLSCLHVAEHVGLGRYGDPLDPEGTVKAAAELQRVVAPGGQLLFSGPVGTPRVCFNAHRIHDPRAIPEMFGELELEEFAGVDDSGRFALDLEPADLAGARYGCGLYRFVRPD